MGIGEVIRRSPAIFLDRDGIINRAIVRDGKPYPPMNLDEMELLPWTSDSLRGLHNLGYMLIGITNQPDVARGRQTRQAVEAMHAWLLRQLPLQAIFVCYHDEADHCNCRKPRPGLILEAADKYHLDLSQSWMVGDRWKDIAAGQAAGLRTIFVDYRYSESYACPPAEFVVEDTTQVSHIILKGRR